MSEGTIFQRVVKELKSGEIMTRTTLAKRMPHSTASVSSVVRKMLNMGILEEIGQHGPRGGAGVRLKVNDKTRKIKAA